MADGGYAHRQGGSAPADGGASGLGLIMQLGGGLFLGMMTMTTFNLMTVSTKMKGTGVFVLFGLLSMLRSAFHMTAGSSLLYSPARSEFNNKGPLRWTYIYIATATTHTAVFMVMLKSKMKLNTAQSLSMAALLLAWPVTLLIVIRLGRLSRFTDKVPPPRDRGFEQAGVLMCLLGTIGVLYAGLLTLGLMGIPKAMSSVEGLTALVIFVGLLARSVMHVTAGFKAVHGAPMFEVRAAADKYRQWGTISTVVSIFGFFVILAMNKINGPAIIMMMAFGYLLFLWPRLIGRFFDVRGDTYDIYGDEQPQPSRAPDLGMSALGWLLLALAVQGLAATLPDLLLGAPKARQSMAMPMFGMNDIAALGGRSRWLSVGVAGLQLWAALELLGMTTRYKVATWAYGIGATVLTIYLSWPVLKQLGSAAKGVRGGGVVLVGIYGQVAIGLVIPIITLLLVQRRLSHVDVDEVFS